MAARQGIHNVAEGYVAGGQQDQQVVEDIGGLGCERGFVVFYRFDDGLDGLSLDLLEWKTPLPTGTPPGLDGERGMRAAL